MTIIVGEKVYKATLRKWDGDNWKTDILNDIENAHTAEMTEEEFVHFKKNYEYEVENAEHGNTELLNKGRYSFSVNLINGFEVDGKVFTNGKELQIYQKKKELKENIEEVISILQKEVKSIEEGYLMINDYEAAKKLMLICIENAKLTSLVSSKQEEKYVRIVGKME